jgi:hypothetical protein
MDGGGLLKTVQEASLTRSNRHWPLLHINSCKTPWSLTQEPRVVCVYVAVYICKSPPPVCQCDREGSPSPLQGAGETHNWQVRLAGHEWLTGTFSPSYNSSLKSFVSARLLICRWKCMRIAMSFTRAAPATQGLHFTGRCGPRVSGGLSQGQNVHGRWVTQTKLVWPNCH